MALSNAEKVRRYRENQKKKEQIASLTLEDIFKRPFFESLHEDYGRDSQFADCLEFVGMEVPTFKDDRGLEDFTHYYDQSAEDFIPRGLGSLGRAEAMVTALIEAAQDLAWHVADYKRQEIKARLAEIEASDLSDPDTKKAALRDSARLNKMLEQLDKQVRWSFPQWKVHEKGPLPIGSGLSGPSALRDGRD